MAVLSNVTREQGTRRRCASTACSQDSTESNPSAHDSRWHGLDYRCVAELQTCTSGCKNLSQHLPSLPEKVQL